MKKLSIGLLAAVAIALVAAPAEAKSKKSGGKKGKPEVAKSIDRSPLGEFGCFLSGMAGTKSPGPACGR